MRVLLDTNVYISYLLAPTEGRHPNTIVEAAFSGHITLLVSQRLVDELVSRVTTKPYLAQRITREDLQDLIAAIRGVAELFDDFPDELPRVGNDRDDDYLFAHAAIERPSCIVSGDGGMQRVGEIDGIPILTPARFVQVLKELGILESDQNDLGS
ncbi:MAG: putative toxin-antitoxin system toxin component, PIN family [Thermomicrobiales bacterium]